MRGARLISAFDDTIDPHGGPAPRHHVHALFVARDDAQAMRWADAARDTLILQATCVTNVDEALAAIAERRFDAIVAAHETSAGPVRLLLRSIAALEEELPAIVVGPLEADELPELFALGALDVVRLAEIDRLGPALLRAVRFATISRALRQAREEVHVLRSAVTGERETAGRIAHLATHDVLTDLPHRPLFEQRVSAALTLAQKTGRHTGVVFLDIDRFKSVNELAGHDGGDEVIRSIAYRMRRAIGENDIVSRFGGDEFVVLLADADSPEDVRVRAEEIVATARPPLHLNDREIYVTVSAGVSVSPGNADESATLIATAETAMYEAKRMGRNMLRPYTTSMVGSPTERQSLQRDLHHAIEREELELYYQPMYDIESRTITGVEALLRWRHPVHGIVLPDRFIPMAEESGAIEPIGDWVIGRACEQMRDWKDAGIASVRVSVNVSARQLESPDLLDRMYAHVQRCMIEPSSLEIELTETAIMRDVPAAIRLLCDLKEIGFRVSIDDFGTGYTSLRFLKRFPVDVLKIDRSFIRDVATGVFDGAVVRAVTTLARGLGVVTIAEGVEAQAQFDRLRDLECDEVQGFLFSRPLRVQDCTPLLIGRERAAQRGSDRDSTNSNRSRRGSSVGRAQV